MKKILLSKNWNEKLCCDAFLIIKPASSDYKTGEQVLIETKLNKVFIEEYDVTNFFFSENSILKFAEYTQRNGDNSNNWFPFFCYMYYSWNLFVLDLTVYYKPIYSLLLVFYSFNLLTYSTIT